jgi:hypothetical protein
VGRKASSRLEGTVVVFEGEDAGLSERGVLLAGFEDVATVPDGASDLRLGR